MSGLIKSGEAALAGVRSLSAARRPMPPPRPIEPPLDAELVSLRLEAAALREALEARDTLIARHEDALDHARREGEAAGRAAGLKEAQDGRAERLAVLEGALAKALAGFAEDTASLERLAGLLASRALEKVLGDEGQYAALTAAALRRQMEAIDRSAVVRIEVAREDFPDAEALAALAAAAGQPDVEVRALKELRPGDCRIKLQLGSVEIGPGQQWARLRAALEALGQGELGE